MAERGQAQHPGNQVRLIANTGLSQDALDLGADSFDAARSLMRDLRLSPDGARLLIPAYVATTDSDGVNQVWQCDPRLPTCDHEVLLEIADPDSVFSDLGEALWEVAPSADSARFFAILVGENNSSFDIHLAEQDGAGESQLADRLSEVASLYYRDLSGSGSAIVIREVLYEDDLASSDTVPFNGYVGADAY